MLRKLVYRLLCVPIEETSLQKRGFPDCEQTKQTRLEAIGKWFLFGYHTAIQSPDLSSLNNSFSGIDKTFIGFVYEGAAMSLRLMDFLLPGHRIRRLLSNPTGDRHIYMIHVGIGWAIARAPLNLSREIKKFDPVLRWLIVDGYGFHQGYFHTRRFIYNKELPRCIDSPALRSVYYQGIGRSLWFVESAGIDGIKRRIDEFDTRDKADLWAGVGLACAYAGGVGEQELYQLKDAARTHLPQLAQGVAFAAKARERAGNNIEYMERVSAIICGSSPLALAALTDECLTAVPHDLPSAERYAFWRTNIMKALTKNTINEHVLE